MAIFSSQFLTQYLNNFDQLQVVDFKKKKLIIENWVQSIQSGKIDAEKEISIKSIFVSDFFGDILGYQFKNSNIWLLKEEHKSLNDGSRSDAALGYFGLIDGKIDGEVRMVVEFKNSSNSLDQIQQNRSERISAVDQAFLYASKQSGKCNWIAVCNVREIRFYHYNTQTEFQKYYLEELLDETKLLELLFLFHAEHVLSRSNTSRTDKLYELSKKSIQITTVPSGHIIDELYMLMKKFDALPFVDPVYLTNLYPFNILNQKVWHYHEGVMGTTNPGIYRLLEGITIKDKTIIISPELENEIKDKNVEDALKKLHYVFEKLNKSLVFKLTAVEDIETVKQNKRDVLGFSLYHDNGFSKDYGIWRNINVFTEKDCNCAACLYSRLHLKALMHKLKKYAPEEIDMEYAYGKYLLCAHVDNHPYHALKKLERQYKGTDNNIASYFVTKINLKNLSGVINGDGDNGRAIRSALQSMDLDAVIAYEVDLFASPELRAYLVEMKSSVLIERLANKASYSKERTKEIMEINLRGDHIMASDQIASLIYQRTMLNLYCQANFIMIDHIGKVNSIYLDIFQAYIYSYLTPGAGLEEFSAEMLSDAILHIHPSDLAKSLSEIDIIRTSDNTRTSMLTKAKNLLNSFLEESFGRTVENPDMKAQMLDVYSYFAIYRLIHSTFTVLCKIDFATSDILGIVSTIVKFLQIGPNYPDGEMKPLAELIEKHATAFSIDDFLQILGVIVPKLQTHSHQHDNIFNAICRAWDKAYPEKKIINVKLINQAVVNHMNGSNPDYLRLINLWRITDTDLQHVITTELKRFLSINFNSQLYETLIHAKVFGYDEENYFFFIRLRAAAI